MKSDIPEDADQRRLAVAAHEIGHLIGWQHAGYQARDVWVRGHGDATRGRVTLGTIRINTVGQARGYLVGLLAGRAADIRWCTRAGIPFQEHRCRGDIAQLKRLRRRNPEWFQRFPVRDLRIEARDLVRANWRRVERLAATLAETGHLTP